MSKNTLVKIINIFLEVLLSAILVLTLICCISMMNAKKHNEVPSIFGYSVVTVLTDSMSPEYPAGSVVVLKSVSAEDVKAGDIIAFYGGENREHSKVIFHRVLVAEKLENSENGLDGIYFATQGDANGDLYDAINPNNQYEVGDANIPSDAVAYDPSQSYSIGWKSDTNSLGLYDKENNPLTGAIEFSNEKYLVGKYVGNVGILGSFVKFCSSTFGIVLLVLIPAGLLLTILIIEFVKQIKVAKEEKQKQSTKARIELNDHIDQLKKENEDKKDEKKDAEEVVIDLKSDDLEKTKNIKEKKISPKK